jgi:hypothetical protein
MARVPRKAAKAAKKGSSKKSAARKAPAKARQTNKAAAPRKQRNTSSKTAARKGGNRTGSTGQNWSGAIEALVNSSMGRGVLADVLEAAAGALRKARKDVDEAVEASATAVSAAGDTAVSVGTEVASGAAALVQTATEAMADIVTTTAENFLSPDKDDERKRRSSRSGSDE